VGLNAAKMAVGLGAEVTVLDSDTHRLRELDDIFGGRVRTVYSNQETLERCVLASDLVVGAVLIPGASAPKLVSEDLVKQIEDGSVLVDVSIDQGGCFETSRPTTHADPTYTVHGVVHYCVANMPGGVARTSALALNNATLPFVIQLADKGLGALTEDDHLLHGLNVHRGKITYSAVAQAQGLEYFPAEDVLA
jgi:alanine dehydrogenase